MASKKVIKVYCKDNGTTFKIGEEWSDQGVCNLKTCEPGGNISIKQCLEIDTSSGCSRIEGDLNQTFPQCCPTQECSLESSSESSSSSSSDEEEDDLFDDDGESMDVFRMEESNSQNKNNDDQVDLSNTKTEVNITKNSGQKTIEKTKIAERDNKSDKDVHREVKNSQFDKLDKITNTVVETTVSNENINFDVTDDKSILGVKGTVLDDITNTETTKNGTPTNTEKNTATVHETQNRIIHSEDNNDHVTREKSEILIIDNGQVYTEKEIEPHGLGVEKSIRHSSEFGSAENPGSIRERVDRDVIETEHNECTQVKRNNSQESMDNINYSALGQEVKEEKELQVMDELEESDQYKLSNYLENIGNDSKLKNLIDFQTSTEKIILENPSDFKDVTVTNEVKNDFLLNKMGIANADSTDGIIYNPDDSEGFLKKPEDLLIESIPNDANVESTFKEVNFSSFSSSSQPTMAENVDSNLELDGERRMDTEVLKQTEEAETFLSRGDTVENIEAHIYDTHETETQGLDVGNIEETRYETYSNDANVFTEESTDNGDFTSNTGNSNGVGLNEDISDFTGNNIANIEDAEQFHSFDGNLENHADVNFEETAEIHNEITDIQRDDEESLPGNLGQDIGDSAETMQTYQIPEENYVHEHDFHEIEATEVTEDQTYSSEYSSTLETTSESTSTGLDNSSENTE